MTDQLREELGNVSFEHGANDVVLLSQAIRISEANMTREIERALQAADPTRNWQCCVGRSCGNFDGRATIDHLTEVVEKARAEVAELTAPKPAPTRFVLSMVSGFATITQLDGKVLWTIESRASNATDEQIVDWLNEIAVEPEVVRWIFAEWGVGDQCQLGYSPGDFYKGLFKALGHADKANLAKIGEGYPALVAVVSFWKNVSRSPEILAAFIAGSWDKAEAA